MVMKAVYTILLLSGSNLFMTFAWYGHLKSEQVSLLKSTGLFGLILVSWGLAFFEYCLQVPANRIGFRGTGGPFSLVELKVIQEVITLAVFVVFSFFFFKDEVIRWNHLAAFFCLVMAVYFVFYHKINA